MLDIMMSMIFDIAEVAPQFHAKNGPVGPVRVGPSMHRGQPNWQQRRSIPHRSRRNTPPQRGVIALSVMDA